VYGCMVFVAMVWATMVNNGDGDGERECPFVRSDV
jgi:hypothetical protein